MLPQEELKKAKLKALKLLEHMDRTEQQLREKLLAAGFGQEAVGQAMDYVKSFGYLDDERYVRNYIESRQTHKSRFQIVKELKFCKGVPSGLIEKVCAELGPADELGLIRKELLKKHFNPEDCEGKQRQKIIASLLRKGFKMEDIRAAMAKW